MPRSPWSWIPTLVLLVSACASDSLPVVGGGAPQRSIHTRVLVPGQGGTGGAQDGGIDGGHDGGVDAGACDNLPDLDAIASTNLNAVMTSCTGLVCLNALLDPLRYEECVTGCVEFNVPTMSSECAACYGGVARCGFDAFCLGVCQFNTCGLQCLNCLNFTGCLAEFEDCRGIPGDSCEGGGLPFIPNTDNQ